MEQRENGLGWTASSLPHKVQLDLGEGTQGWEPEDAGSSPGSLSPLPPPKLASRVLWGRYLSTLSLAFSNCRVKATALFTSPSCPEDQNEAACQL